MLGSARRVVKKGSKLAGRAVSEASLGLTSVHINRTLQALRKTGMVELENRRLVIHDMAGLKHLGEFDPDYLYLEKKPR